MSWRLKMVPKRGFSDRVVNLPVTLITGHL